MEAARAMKRLGQGRRLPRAILEPDRAIQRSLSTPIRTRRPQPRRATRARRVLPDPVVPRKSYVVKSFPQFQQSPTDSGFNRTERLPKPCRNFVMTEMLKKSHFDRLALFRRQIVQHISHTRRLIILLSGIRSALDGGCIGGGGVFSRGAPPPPTRAPGPQTSDLS